MHLCVLTLFYYILELIKFSLISEDKITTSYDVKIIEYISVVVGQESLRAVNVDCYKIDVQDGNNEDRQVSYFSFDLHISPEAKPICACPDMEFEFTFSILVSL